MSRSDQTPPDHDPPRLGVQITVPRGRVPFGCRQNPYGRVVYDAELKWIEYIDELASQGFSTDKIAHILNKEDRQTKRSGKWSRTAVWRILKRFEKKAVTKSFCNDPVEAPHSVTPPTIASKTPPGWIRTISPSRNRKPSSLEISKPLQINDFEKALPGSNTHRTDLKHFPPHGVGGPAKAVVAGNAVLDPRIVLANLLALWDESLFDQVNGAKGQIRILFPAEAQAIRDRQRRYRPPRPPPIQGLLQRALKLKEQRDATPGLTRFALAKSLSLDPTRISQILNLLNLAPEIQAYIRNLCPTKHHDPIGDREWVRLCRLSDPGLQVQEFQRLLGRSAGPPGPVRRRKAALSAAQS